MPCSTTKESYIREENIFYEAISHCRWKQALYSILDTIAIEDYKDKTFEEIITLIYDKCSPVKGVGNLAIYDITAAICKYHNLDITKVYIIGGGPKRAIKLLNISHKRHIISQEIRFNYVEVCDVVKAFSLNNYKLDKQRTGDDYESYLCNWQKNIC